MADNKGVRAGRAFVELGTEDSAFVKGLKKAQAKLKAFGAAVRTAGIGLTGIGGALTAPILAAVKGFDSAGTAALDMANRTGLSVEAIQELGYAAKQNGADFSELEVGIRKMQKSIYDAELGLSTAKDALSVLGLAVADLKGKRPEEQFQLIADRLNRIKDPSLKAAAAVSLLGRSGTTLLPMIGQLGELRAEARRLGFVMSDEDAKAAHAFGDAITALRAALSGVQYAVGSAVAPMLSRLIRAVSEGLGVFAQWIRQHQELVVLTLKVGAAITAAGAATIGLGFAFTGMAKALDLVIAPIRMAGMLTGLLSAVMSALVSPLGLVAAAVAGLGAAVLIYTDAGAKALAWLGNTFKWLRDTVGAVMQAIVDSLAAGDIAAAADVLWAALRLAWVAGTNKLNEIWLSAANWIATQLIDIWAGVRDAFEFAVDAMARAWTALTYGMRSAWVSFSAWHQRAVEGMANYLAKAWVEVLSIFDSSINLEAAKDAIDQASSERYGEIEANRQKDLNRLTQERAEAQRAADREHIAQLRKIEEEAQKAKEALDAATAPQNEEAQAALEQARQRLAEALARARHARENAEAKAAPEKPTGAGQNPFGDLAGAVGEKMSALGTFSAAAVWGMATTPLSDIARNTAIANQHLERIEKKEAPRPAFT
jgi:hypothetical protein